MKAELVLGNLKRERDALDGRLERLYTALCKEWQDEDQEYLCTQQYNAMSLYAHILDERIADIEYKLEKKKAKIKDTCNHETCHENKDAFNKKIDLNSCKEYNNCNCSDKEKCWEERNPKDIIIEIIREVYGDDIF